MARWLHLSPLVEVQKNIRTLRSQIKLSSEDNSALLKIDIQLTKESSQIVKTWDATGIISYINSNILAPLDNKLSMATLSNLDKGYVEICARAKHEENKIGLTGLRQISSAVKALWATNIDDGNKIVVSGAIKKFETAISKLKLAKSKEMQERKNASNAAFETLWKAAEPLFVEGSPKIEFCPICDTPIIQTRAGSLQAIHGYITRNLTELSVYAAAKIELERAISSVTESATQLIAVLDGLICFLVDDSTELKSALTSYRSEIIARGQTEVIDSTNIVKAITDFESMLNQQIIDIKTRQGEYTYAKAKIKVDRLIELQEDRVQTIKIQNELSILSDALSEQGAIISFEIRKKMQGMLDFLQSPMNEIYKIIQGEHAVPLHLELPPEDEANQQRLSLLIDFAKNRTGVQPSGYLSDSQIHSVALALQMAAIMRFNTGAPIIFLDDIVTSYDADHRRNIAGLLAKYFDNYQILITTHDERFFCYLKDQLEGGRWHFTRIIGLNSNSGPLFDDHKISDEMIEDRWAGGHSAANEMRQAEEEWLLNICRDFGVSIRIRTLDKAYSYERSELASALAQFLKKTELLPPIVHGVKNRFLNSLQKGEIENFGSHFQDNPHCYGSIGDERTRWSEFKEFKSFFVCKKCNRKKFKRPYNLAKPVCACSSCEAQLEFNMEVIGKTSS